MKRREFVNKSIKAGILTTASLAFGNITELFAIRPQDYEKSESTVLLERLGISNVNETKPIEVFVVSLWINVSSGRLNGSLTWFPQGRTRAMLPELQEANTC